MKVRVNDVKLLIVVCYASSLGRNNRPAFWVYYRPFISVYFLRPILTPKLHLLSWDQVKRNLSYRIKGFQALLFSDFLVTQPSYLTAVGCYVTIVVAQKGVGKKGVLYINWMNDWSWGQSGDLIYKKNTQLFSCSFS